MSDCPKPKKEHNPIVALFSQLRGKSTVAIVDDKHLYYPKWECR